VMTLLWRVVATLCLPFLSGAVGMLARGRSTQVGGRDANDAGTITPLIVAASHNVAGFGPECATDGKESTFWLVPGGQRMEMMSRDKWIVLDLETPRQVCAISFRGIVGSFGPARVLLDVGSSAQGPWQRVGRLRALGAPLRWQRHELGQATPPSQFMRVYIRREGHATFRHAIHGVLVHCNADDGA